MIHLVSYGTNRFRHRQMILSASGVANRVVKTFESWNPKRLAFSGFNELVPDISLDERGSGFWAWKPYIILQKLNTLAEGEVVLYCDVGRRFPYIELECSLEPFIQWMNDQQQDIMPGVYIPWNGPMSKWTKREAWISMNMDKPENHMAIPIQASFSLWRNSQLTRNFVSEWFSLCRKRNLISDDPSANGMKEHPDFIEHRHDQSLLNLCCLRHDIRGIDIGSMRPIYNERNPSTVCHHHFDCQHKRSRIGAVIHGCSIIAQAFEHVTLKFMRKLRAN